MNKEKNATNKIFGRKYKEIKNTARFLNIDQKCDQIQEAIFESLKNKNIKMPKTRK